MKENLTSCKRKKINKQFSNHLKKVQVFQSNDDWETWLFLRRQMLFDRANIIFIPKSETKNKKHIEVKESYLASNKLFPYTGFEVREKSC